MKIVRLHMEKRVLLQVEHPHMTTAFYGPFSSTEDLLDVLREGGWVIKVTASGLKLELPNWRGGYKCVGTIMSLSPLIRVPRKAPSHK